MLYSATIRNFVIFTYQVNIQLNIPNNIIKTLIIDVWFKFGGFWKVLRFKFHKHYTCKQVLAQILSKVSLWDIKYKIRFKKANYGYF